MYINCPECNLLIPSDIKACTNCGFPLPNYVEKDKNKSINCPECNVILPAHINVCTNCGYPIYKDKVFANSETKIDNIVINEVKQIENLKNKKRTFFSVKLNYSFSFIIVCFFISICNLLNLFYFQYFDHLPIIFISTIIILFIFINYFLLTKLVRGGQWARKLLLLTYLIFFITCLIHIIFYFYVFQIFILILTLSVILFLYSNKLNKYFLVNYVNNDLIIKNLKIYIFSIYLSSIVLIILLLLFVKNPYFHDKIINNYLVLDEELVKTNKNLKDKIDWMYITLSNAKEKDSINLKPKYIAAMEIKKLCFSMDNYISRIKDTLIKIVDGNNRPDTVRAYQIDDKYNYNIGNRLLVGKSKDGTMGEARILRNKLCEFKSDIFAILKNPKILILNKDEQLKYLGDLGIDTKDPGENIDNPEKRYWETSKFYNMPLVGTITNLSMIQNQVKNAESTVVNLLLSGMSN